MINASIGYYKYNTAQLLLHVNQDFTGKVRLTQDIIHKYF